MYFSVRSLLSSHFESFLNYMYACNLTLEVSLKEARRYMCYTHMSVGITLKASHVLKDVPFTMSKGKLYTG